MSPSFPWYWLNADAYRNAQWSGLTSPLSVCVRVCICASCKSHTDATLPPRGPRCLPTTKLCKRFYTGFWSKLQRKYKMYRCFIWSGSAAFPWQQQTPKIKFSLCATSVTVFTTFASTCWGLQIKRSWYSTYAQSLTVSQLNNILTVYTIHYTT